MTDAAVPADFERLRGTVRRIMIGRIQRALIATLTLGALVWLVESSWALFSAGGVPSSEMEILLLQVGAAFFAVVFAGTIVYNGWVALKAGVLLRETTSSTLMALTAEDLDDGGSQ